MKLSLKKSLKIDFEEAIRKVTDELSKEGFGIITSIDVKEVLKKKLNKDFRKFLILGACNPEFAHKALEINDEISLLLPCNIVIQEKEEVVEVLAFNPEMINSIFQNAELEKLSGILKQKIDKVFNNL